MAAKLLFVAQDEAGEREEWLPGKNTKVKHPTQKRCEKC